MIFYRNGIEITTKDLGKGYPWDWLDSVLQTNPEKLVEMGISWSEPLDKE